jgi:DNA polymerase-1
MILPQEDPLPRERLFIMDAFAHIFRAYYGIRNIDYNAVFGFHQILKKIVESEQPEYLVAAFDSPIPSFRKELFPAYKANRMAPPEDLAPQIPLIKELLDCFHVPILEMPGFEADDIIGSLAELVAGQGIQVVIVSGDKDMLQLLRGRDIVLYDSSKGAEYLAEEGVPAYFGVRADQIVDLLTIWGDSSDNVPGVPGVGEKGAKSLIQQYGSLAGIYEHLDEISRKSYREGFAAAKPHLELTRTLVTIKTDLPLPGDLKAMRRQDPDRSRLMDFYRRLNFRSLLEEQSVQLAQLDREFTTIQDEEILREWCMRLQKESFFVFDTESTGLDPLSAHLVGMSLADGAGRACYVPLTHVGQSREWAGKAMALLRTLMEEEGPIKVAHNLKFDLSLLRGHGWNPRGPFEDTMLMSHLIAPAEMRHGLDDLAERRLSYRTIRFEEVAGSKKEQLTFDQVPIERASQYAAEDAEVCLRLYRDMEGEIERLGLARAYREVELPLIPVLAAMEQRGVRIDAGLLKQQSRRMEMELGQLEQTIQDKAGLPFNLNSPRQVAEILFQRLQMPSFGKTGVTKEYSTSSEVLEKLAAMGFELPQLLLEYRMLKKLKSTYIDELPKLVHPKTGRVHSSFNQFVTATGRLSSNHPNLQNIPIRSERGAEIRAAFVPEPGWLLVAADYSQIELRLLAHFSEDAVLLDAFRHGEDIHRRTASEIMNVPLDQVDARMRRAAKSINFGLIYGMGEFRLSQELGIPRKLAAEYMESYFRKMPGVQAFQKAWIESCKAKQEVRTWCGRRRPLPELLSRNKSLVRQGERLAVNTLIQGTAAEVIKLAMIRLEKRLQGMESRMLLQVHDELVLECPPKELEVAREVLVGSMEECGSFRVPLTVEVKCGPNWKEVK